MSNSFVPLHLHSCFSYLDSISKPSEIAKRGKEIGYESIAISDHGHCGGHIKFQKECKKNEVKPILGCEVYMTPDHSIKERSSYHLTLLAATNDGLSNLYKMLTVANRPVDDGGGFYFKPRISWKELEEYNNGIICLTGCMASMVNRAFVREGYDAGKAIAERLLSIFGKENLFAEAQNVNENGIIYIPEHDFILECTRKLGKDLGIDVVATNDSHWIYKGKDELPHEIMKCIEARGTLSTPIADPEKGTRGRLVYRGTSYYLMSDKEMRGKFTDEEVNNTAKVAAKCTASIPLKQNHMPKFDDNMTDEQVYEKLRKECFKGFKELGIDKKLNKQVYIDRMKVELKDIQEAGLQNYFMIVWDVIRHCRENNIPTGPGRGSVGGSLAAYLLRIHNVDPIEYGLIFERFWNRGRKGSMPDVDLDIAIDRREEVIDYLRNKFGKDRVYPMVTFSTMSVKAALKDVGKALGLTFDYTNELCKKIPHKCESIDDAIKDSKYIAAASTGADSDVIKWKAAIKTEQKQQVPDKSKIYKLETDIADRAKVLIKTFEIAKRLEDITRQRSSHACALLIADKDIFGKIPLVYDSANKKMLTGFDMYDLEEMGYLKLDILGLKTLSVLTKVHPEGARAVKTFDDPEVFNLISNGDTKGVFQLESPLGKQWCRKLQPKTILEIADLVSLIRPAVLEAGLADEYIKNKFSPEEVLYLHPDLKPIFQNTHGVMCIAEGGRVKTDKGLLRIEEVSKGMLAQTLNGKYYTVLDRINNGKKECLKVRMTSGESLCVTADHKIFTNRGWIAAGKLTTNDLVKQHWVCDDKIAIGDDKDWIIGLLLADGDLCAGTPNVACSSREFAENVKFIADKAWGLNSVVYKSRRTWYCRFTSNANGIMNGNLLTAYCRKNHLLNKYYNTKEFPNSVSLSMMAGFFEGDGSVINNRLRIKNEKLARRFFEVLSSARISASIDYTNKDNVWTVVVNGYLPLRIKKQRILNEGFVPRPDLRFVAKHDGYIFDNHKRSNLPYITVRAYKLLCNKYPNHLQYLSEPWGKVISIQVIGEKQVYDLSIDTEHSFVVGGSVVHNCYQEQMIQVAKVFAGFSLEQADALRKATGKKLPEEMAKYKDAFIQGCLKNNHNQALAEELWGWTEKGASYSFNASHAVSYAMLAYTTAWMKRYYPEKFFCAMLQLASNEAKPQEEISELFYDAQSLGVKIVAPSFQKMNADFTIGKDKEIYYGLGHIKHIGASMVCKFQDLKINTWNDVLKNRRTLKKDTLHALICSGSFDYLDKTRRAMKLQIDFLDELTDKELVLFRTILNQAKYENKTKVIDFANTFNPHCSDKFVDAANILRLHIENPELKLVTKNRATTLLDACNKFLNNEPSEEFGMIEKAGYEIYYLGIPATCSQVDVYHDDRKTHNVLDIKNERDKIGAATIAIINEITEKTDKKGNSMAFLSIFDKTYMIDAIIFSDAYGKYRSILEKGKVYYFDGYKNRGSFCINHIEAL